MKERFEKLRDRIDALSLRERVLVFLAIVAVVTYLWHALFMTPLGNRQDQLQQQVEDLRNRVAEINNSIAEVIESRRRDPDAERRARLSQLEDEINALDERLAGLTGELIEPRRMAHVLEQILESQSGLELVALESLEPRPLLEDENLEGVGNIYRHGVRIELRGSFNEILQYLQALESLDSSLYWGRLAVDLERYPDNRVVIVVHSLSLREGWIGV